MENLKQYKNHYGVDSQEISQTLVNLAGIPAEYTPELENAIYYIQAAAQNSYNADYFKILFNTLAIIAEGGPEA